MNYAALGRIYPSRDFDRVARCVSMVVGLVYYLGWVVAVAGGSRDRRTAGSPRRRLSDGLSSGLGWTPEPQAGRALDIFRIRSSERE